MMHLCTFKCSNVIEIHGTSNSSNQFLYTERYLDCDMSHIAFDENMNIIITGNGLVQRDCIDNNKHGSSLGSLFAKLGLSKKKDSNLRQVEEFDKHVEITVTLDYCNQKGTCKLLNVKTTETRTFKVVMTIMAVKYLPNALNCL